MQKTTYQLSLMSVCLPFDPVALDMACADMANQAPVISGSYLEEQLKRKADKPREQDHFVTTHPETN